MGDEFEYGLNDDEDLLSLLDQAENDTHHPASSSSASPASAIIQASPMGFAAKVSASVSAQTLPAIGAKANVPSFASKAQPVSITTPAARAPLSSTLGGMKQPAPAPSTAARPLSPFQPPTPTSAHSTSSTSSSSSSATSYSPVSPSPQHYSHRPSGAASASFNQHMSSPKPQGSAPPPSRRDPSFGAAGTHPSKYPRIDSSVGDEDARGPGTPGGQRGFPQYPTPKSIPKSGAAFGGRPQADRPSTFSPRPNMTHQDLTSAAAAAAATAKRNLISKDDPESLALHFRSGVHQGITVADVHQVPQLAVQDVMEDRSQKRKLPGPVGQLPPLVCVYDDLAPHTSVLSPKAFKFLLLDGAREIKNFEDTRGLKEIDIGGS